MKVLNLGSREIEVSDALADKLSGATVQESFDVISFPDVKAEVLTDAEVEELYSFDLIPLRRANLALAEVGVG